MTQLMIWLVEQKIESEEVELIDPPQSQRNQDHMPRPQVSHRNPHSKMILLFCVKKLNP